jgi:hypothetical protein
MKAKLAMFLFLGAATSLTGCSHTGGSVEHIDGQTPPAVMEGFNREFPGLTLSHTDRVTYLDKTVKYELKFRDADRDYRRKLFDAQGKLLDPKWDVKLPAQTAPAK